MSAPARQTLAVVRRVAIVVVMMVIVVRPSWGETTVKVKEGDLDVLVLIDRTRSMIALDGPGGAPRLALVRKDLRELAADLPGSRFGAITFGGEVVREALPFTTDTSALDALVDTLEVEGPVDGVGSKLDAPLPKAVDVLADDQREYPGRRRIVVLLSDGENTAEGPQQSFSSLRSYVDGGVVLGYGTTGGGKMLIDSDDPSQGYMTDPSTGEDAVSRIDVDNLETVAGELGVGFVHRTAADPAQLAGIAHSFRSGRADTEHTTREKAEKTWIFGFALLPLLLWELWSQRRRAREVREMLG